MSLSKKHQLIGDIVNTLKVSQQPQIWISDLYSTLIVKYRNYLTRNRFFAVLMEMKKKGFVDYDGKKIALTEGVKNLPTNEILMRFTMNWPTDIVQGLI